MPRLLLAVPAILLSLLGAAAHAALYAIDPFHEGTTLYRVEIEPARITPIGLTGVPLLIDLAADANGRLLAIDALVGETRHLYELDPRTGQATPILDLGTSSMIAEGSMAIHQGTNAAYVIARNELFTLDLATGNRSAWHQLALNGALLTWRTNIDGLVFRNDELFGLITIDSPLAGQLVRIDPEARTVTPIGHTGLQFGSTAALAYDPQTDTLYLAAAGLASIYSVDPETARVTPVASVPFSQSPGLTYAQVPEPAGLLSLAGLALLSIRRRARR